MSSVLSAHRHAAEAVAAAPGQERQSFLDMEGLAAGRDVGD